MVEGVIAPVNGELSPLATQCGVAANAVPKVMVQVVAAAVWPVTVP